MDARIRFFREMEKEYEGFYKAVRLVLQATKKGILSGIHGSVAELMTTEGFAIVLLLYETVNTAPFQVIKP